MHPLLTLLAAQIPGAVAHRDLMRAKPHKRAATPDARDSLLKAYGERAEKAAGSNPIQQLSLNPNVAPTGAKLREMIESNDPEIMFALNPMQYASHGSKYAPGPDGQMDIAKGQRLPSSIQYNPNADEIYLAHELGHQTSLNSPVGDKFRRLRDLVGSNPKLAVALGAAAGITPIAAAAMTPGDDDLDEAMLGTIALASPILIDEALASKNALALMEDAGRPARLGQHARLAGGYLSYLAAPITAAVLGNSLGNIIDEDV